MRTRSTRQNSPEPTLWLKPDLRSKATVFSVAVGLFFGLNPAKRTAELKAVGALRDHQRRVRSSVFLNYGSAVGRTYPVGVGTGAPPSNSRMIETPSTTHL